MGRQLDPGDMQALHAELALVMALPVAGELELVIGQQAQGLVALVGDVPAEGFEGLDQIGAFKAVDIVPVRRQGHGFGGVAAVREQLTVGTLTALVALLARLYGPLIQLSNLRVDIMTALAEAFNRGERETLPRTIGGRYGHCTMCIGVGPGIALIIERV